MRTHHPVRLTLRPHLIRQQDTKLSTNKQHIHPTRLVILQKFVDLLNALLHARKCEAVSFQE